MKTLFPDELTRIQYLLRFIVWVGVSLVTCALLLPIAVAFGCPNWIPLVIIIPLLVMRLPCLDFPRCRNMGWSPWLLLLLLLPPLNLFIALSLFFWPPRTTELAY
jgi:hypothetical protein